MNAMVRIQSGPESAAQWIDATDQLLDEHHLVAWSRNPGVRERYALEVSRHYRLMPETQTLLISGAAVHTLEGFAKQIERGLPDVGPVGADLRAPGGIIEALRRRPEVHGGPSLKHRYYLWRDADVLLRRSPELFGEVLDAIMGVAAEAEYAGEDLLLLHRLVLIGGPELHDYAHDAQGALSRWLPLAGKDACPLWKIISGVELPPVAELEIE